MKGQAGINGAFGLNLTVDDQNRESPTSVLGGRISAALSQSRGVLVPQARLGWPREVYQLLTELDFAVGSKKKS